MDALSNIVFHAHSGLRYLVLVAALLSLAFSLPAAIRGREWDRRGRMLLGVFVGLVDLQVLLGLILVFVRAFFPALWGHLAMMVLAAAAAHAASAINKRRPPERRSHWLAVAGTGLALVLIVGGIMAIGRPIL
jgi:heme A synthase